MNPSKRPLIKPARRLLRCLPVACAAWFHGGVEAAAPVVEFVAERDFGYTVGDLIRHRLMIRLEADTELASDLLPAPGPITDGLELRRIEVRRTAQGRHRIDLDYQVLKGVREAEPAAVPPVRVSFRSHGEVIEWRGPEWSFTLMPVIDPRLPDNQVTIRPDRPPNRLPLALDRILLTGGLLGSALCALLLAARLGWMPGRIRPFQRAVREIAKFRRDEPGESAYRMSLQYIHQAIDETAGFAVFPQRLNEFLGEHPAFAALGPEFQKFFALSRQHFFCADGNADLSADAWNFVERFCLDCAKVERRLP